MLLFACRCVMHVTKTPRSVTLIAGNGYATSIHAINSCVIKLSKLTKAGKVWRGIKDATLPKEFWVPNEMGVRGGIEYGFSSTTTEKEQALLYAGSGSSGRDASTIFEMQMGYATSSTKCLQCIVCFRWTALTSFCPHTVI